MNLTINGYSKSTNYIKRHKNVSNNVRQSNSVKFCATQDVLVKSTKTEVPKLIGQYADKLISRGEKYRATLFLQRFYGKNPQLQDKYDDLVSESNLDQACILVKLLLKHDYEGLTEADIIKLRNMRTENIKDKCIVMNYLLLCEKENILPNVSGKIDEIAKKMNDAEDRFGYYKKNKKIDSKIKDLDEMLQKVNPYYLFPPERLKYKEEADYIDNQVFYRKYGQNPDF